MAEVEITLKGYRCDRCSHEWLPKNREESQLPTVCPKCKSPYWNKPRKSAVPTNKKDETGPKSRRKAGSGAGSGG